MPHLEPNQSKKLIKSKGSSSIYNLVQDQKLHTKEFFTYELKALHRRKLSYCFSSTLPKKDIGASIRAFLCFFPMKDPCQPSRVSLTENERTQVTPKRANNNSHKTLFFEQSSMTIVYLRCTPKVQQDNFSWLNRRDIIYFPQASPIRYLSR